MLRATLLVSLVLAPAVVACSKDKEPASQPTKAAPATPDPTAVTGTVGANGLRTVAIEAGLKGYVPDKIPGKPGEKLVLVFTRTVEGECLRELKTPDGKLVELPMNAPLEVPVTVPADGEVKFACGMDMFSGVIVAEKS